MGYRNLNPVKAVISVFSDDVALVKNSIKDLETNIKVWIDILEKHDLIMNINYTEVIIYIPIRVRINQILDLTRKL